MGPLCHAETVAFLKSDEIFTPKLSRLYKTMYRNYTAICEESGAAK